VFIENLTEQVVTSASDVARLIRRGTARRHTAMTQLNERSSRSHAVFRMVIESTAQLGAGAIEAEHPVLVSTLNLVDLAGSERVRESGVEGGHFREAVSINLSLLTLSTVIHRLAESQGKPATSVSRQGSGDPAAMAQAHPRTGRGSGAQHHLSHIPYRESKLTRILQNSLGGNSGTAVICTLSPSPVSVEETLSSLRFASRAKRIVNQARINEVMDDAALLRKYRRQIADLRLELQNVRSHQNVQGVDSDVSMDSDTSAAELARRADEFAAANLELEERLRQEEIQRQAQALKLKRLSEMIMSQPVPMSTTPRRLSKTSSSPDMHLSGRSPGSAPAMSAMSRMAIERAGINASMGTPLRMRRTETGSPSGSKTSSGSVPWWWGFRFFFFF
jgi:centromeric protein E